MVYSRHQKWQKSILATSRKNILKKMAIGGMLELIVVLAHILVKVRQFYKNEKRPDLIEKVNECHCTENAAFCHHGSDTDGLKWSFGFDRFYRRHLGFGKGQGFLLRHGKKSSCPLIFGLILIAGDVSQNRGPSRNPCGECGQ